MNQTMVGLSLLFVAGVMNASFTLPMKYTRRWAWENTWLVWTIFALWVLPPVVTFMTVPSLGSVYREAGLGLVLTVAVFGAGWGIAQVLFGLAVEAIGIALAFSIILGISAAVGSLIPLFQLHADRVLTTGGMGVIAGVALVIIGVAVLALAGRRREAEMGLAPEAGRTSFGRGLLFAIGSGLGAAFINFGLAFGAPLTDAAQRAGAHPLWANNAVWLPVMFAGSIANLAYCVFLMRKNGTAPRFRQSATAGHWALAAFMAFFWFASTLLYGVASGKLGALGPVLGWPLFMSLIVITASVLGMATGEWKNAGRKPVNIMLCGVAVLVVAVFTLSAASRYL
ncbi:MAG TPA: L-rhamnose/proton symporter RhaT [Terriglobales bacterium]|nr:L-rhamnose/proton symporter RhaT [Terriglobales bacterium]